ncbi:MAG: YhcH/YjgK/YiaL family protein [Planctomycetia bacterium]
MILDVFPQWRRYEPLNARFGRAFAFLEGVTPDTAVGRHEIDGDFAYALVQRYETRPAAAMQLEAHRRYIDIQYVVRGREVIHWAPLAALAEVTLPYDDGKDVALFAAGGPMVPVRLPAGQFMILFPDDAHAPCCVWDEPGEVVKVVVKVAV